MTGLNTGHCAIRANTDTPLGPKDVTVAQILKQANYRTCMTGEWLLGDDHTSGLPQLKGFDEFIGFLTLAKAQNYFPERVRRYSPAITDSRAPDGKPVVLQPEFDDDELLYENVNGKRGIYVNDLFTTAAKNFPRIAKPEMLNRFRPFFLFLAYPSPRPGSGLTVPGDSRFSEEFWPQAQKNQALMLTRLDDDVGKLMSELRRLNLATNTVVIFTSDTGPHKDGGVDPAFFHSSGPWRGTRGDLYEGGIRVPLIVHWPQRIKPGQTQDTAWAAWDLLPTAAELAGAAPATRVDGISMLPTLLGYSQTNRHELFYWETHKNGFQQAARMGDWKAVRTEESKPLELYNLSSDPAEKSDVAKDNPDLVAKFKERLKTARTEP
jgi:arylsulfatase A-like enzyme